MQEGSGNAHPDSLTRVVSEAPLCNIERHSTNAQEPLFDFLPTEQRELNNIEQNCLFCAYENPSLNRVIMESEYLYVREDNYPATRGHVEIVPKRHIVSFFEMSDREMRQLRMLMNEVRNEYATTLNPAGYTIGINEGTAAGRSIGHLHIHMIPRYFGDVPIPEGGIRRIFVDFKVTWEDY